MAGIIFFRTKNLSEIKNFYLNKIGMSVWLEQKDCTILRHGNLLLGFCEREEADTSGIITFFYREKSLVDEMYKKLKEIAITEPKINEKYRIYHFFAKDPEGRTIEFQTFLHDTEPYLMGDELLVTRRSIRYFQERDVPDEVLWKIFEICRYSPTSKNSQSYYFVVIRDKEKLKKLATIRGGNSAPIGRAPLAVAICSDPSKSRRYVEDACIAAYHFMLAAWSYGLGTCWIAAMDRDDVKEMLGIPKDHYIATVTPLGYPEYVPEPPPRRPAKEMVKFLP
ncbi:MAG: nitroreductase family protein [Candidatus Njordarchaeales archaeon]